VRISFLLTHDCVISSFISFLSLNCLKFLCVWSKRLQIFLGSPRQSSAILGFSNLQKFSENVQKRFSGLQTTIGESSEIFVKWSQIFRKSPKIFLCTTIILDNNKIKLHGYLEIWNCSSHVGKYFTRLLWSLVKYFSTLEEKFCISRQPWTILYLILY